MPSIYDVKSGEERHGPPRPVMGYRGQPLLDLDVPFRDNPALQVISESSEATLGSDFWIWNQEPAELAAKVHSVRLPAAGGVVEIPGKKGMVRAVDSVILAPRPGPPRPQDRPP